MIKKIIFTQCPLLLSATLVGQIQITSSDMPNAGDSVLLSVMVSSVGVPDPSLTGADYTWDYSTLIENSQHYEVFDSPLNFPLEYDVLFNPLTTSYGKINTALTSIPVPGVQVTLAYSFYKESTSAFKQIGAAISLNSIPLPFKYSSDDIIYKFPMNYLDADSCDYKFGVPIPNISYYGQSGHRVNTVDGWGTLTTPFGTFQTLRILSTISATDTVSISGFGTNVPQPLKYEYKWLAKGMKIPVLQINANDVAGNIVVTGIQYIDSLRTVPQGISEIGSSNGSMSVYPNPAVDNILLKYKFPVNSNVNIYITDAAGKIINNISNENEVKGMHQKNINVADLNLCPGIYFINVRTDDHCEVKKIVLTK